MTQSVKAVILAAGKGTRMKSPLPKVLHKILGKTIIERVVNSVLNLDNIAETIVITGYKSEEVQKNLQNHPVKTILQEPQLGTGHAVAQAIPNLEDFEGIVLVTCGDTPLLTSETLSEFIKTHKNSGSALTVMSAVFKDPANYGRIIRDEQGNVAKIIEEKDANPEQKAVKEINAGVYCLDWKQIAPAFDELTSDNAQGEYYLTDIVDWTVKKGIKAAVYTLKNNYEIFGINSQKHLAEAIKILNNLTIEKLMDEGVTFISPETTFISPETSIGPGTIVYPGCVIEGENIVGENCTIGPLAHLRDGVDIATGVRIGNFVEVKKSVIKDNTNVSHLSYIGDAALGSEVNIGAGTITANYNALTKEKSATIIKDKVKIGSNCVLVAPINIDEGANIAAGSIITKDVPEYSLAIARGKQQIIEKWVEKKLKTIYKNGGNKSGIGIE